MSKPNLMVQSYNYFKAVAKRVLNGFENVDTATYYDRVHTCSRCDYFDHKHKECTDCGCPIETKAAWKTENCPQNKW
ncbi:MAG: hypothetical protein GOVbin568_27 [Prokaryotic dsDNA virus sp.]|nr:MAG: hypothetical protein GOVbin568_27 [Prokaryotic dsDNA virus sp.]